MEASFSPVRGIRTEVDDGTIPHSPEYSLILEDIDHLLKVVLVESSVNPDFYFGALREYPQQFFGLLNKHFTDR